MADEIEMALGEHFYVTADEPSFMEHLMSKESDCDWEREGNVVTELIRWSAEIEEAVAEDVRLVLEERRLGK